MKLLVTEDGNATFYYLSQVPGNFRGIAENIFNIMAKKPFVIFSTDMYYPLSESSRKAQKGKCSKAHSRRRKHKEAKGMAVISDKQ